MAKSKGPRRSPISANAGHTGTVFSSSPSNTVRYAVSPAKYTFFGSVLELPAGMTSSIAHEAHSVAARSKSPRPEKCWQGVQVTLNELEVLLGSALGSCRSTVREFHQSRMWILEEGIPQDSRYGPFPRGAKTWALWIFTSLCRDFVSVL